MKYTLIITDALSHRDRLFPMFINGPHGQSLVNIVASFKDLTRVSHMCGAIDGTRIKLAKKSKV